MIKLFSFSILFVLICTGCDPFFFIKKKKNIEVFVDKNGYYYETEFDDDDSTILFENKFRIENGDTLISWFKAYYKSKHKTLAYLGTQSEITFYSKRGVKVAQTHIDLDGFYHTYFYKGGNKTNGYLMSNVKEIKEACLFNLSALDTTFYLDMKGKTPILKDFRKETSFSDQKSIDDFLNEFQNNVELPNHPYLKLFD